MKAARQIFGSGLGLLMIAVLAISCRFDQREKAVSPPPKQSPEEKRAWLERRLKKVYGEPGPGMVRVYAYGNELKNPGIYYFKAGTSLEAALLVLQTDDFASRLSIYNLANGEETKIHIKFRKLSASEKAEVLHDDDCLYFPVTGW